MQATTKRFISKVMPDGHLLLPEETAKEIGSVFESIIDYLHCIVLH